MGLKKMDIDLKNNSYLLGKMDLLGNNKKIAIRDRRGTAKAISMSNKLMYWGERRELGGVVLV